MVINPGIWKNFTGTWRAGDAPVELRAFLYPLDVLAFQQSSYGQPVQNSHILALTFPYGWLPLPVE